MTDWRKEYAGILDRLTAEQAAHDATRDRLAEEQAAHAATRELIVAMEWGRDATVRAEVEAQLRPLLREACHRGRATLATKSDDAWWSDARADVIVDDLVKKARP